MQQSCPEALIWDQFYSSYQLAICFDGEINFDAIENPRISFAAQVLFLSANNLFLSPFSLLWFLSSSFMVLCFYIFKFIIYFYILWFVSICYYFFILSFSIINSFMLNSEQYPIHFNEDFFRSPFIFLMNMNVYIKNWVKCFWILVTRYWVAKIIWTRVHGSLYNL